MKKFIFLTAIFIFPIFSFIITVEVKLRNIPNDYSYKKKYLDLNSNNIDALFLGSSHVYFGVNPEFSQIKSFNAAHISQSIDYDFEILKKYESNWDNLKVIVIPIDYFTFYSTLKEGSEKWRAKNYALYYDVPDLNLTNNFEILNGKFSNNLKRIKEKYISEETDITCNRFGWGYTYNSTKGNDLFKSGESAAKRHTKIRNEDIIKQNIETLNQIIMWANREEVKIIFFTSPAYKTYVASLNKEQLNNTLDLIQNITSKYSFTKYYNLLNDQSFVEEDFYDADHLNEIGAKKLTIKLDEIILRNISK